MNIKSMINNRTSAMMNQRVNSPKHLFPLNIVTLNPSKETENNQINYR